MITVTPEDIKRDTDMQESDELQRTTRRAYNAHFNSHDCGRQCNVGNDLYEAWQCARVSRIQLYKYHGFCPDHDIDSTEALLKTLSEIK